MGAIIVSVDVQDEIIEPWGKMYNPNRTSWMFLQKVLFPYCRAHGILIRDLVSDYREPRPADPFHACDPTGQGFRSSIPQDILHPRKWVKSQNLCVFTRVDAGRVEEIDTDPYEPHIDTQGFERWARRVMGVPRGNVIVLIGYTLECCVLATALWLNHIGYSVRILEEGTDTNTGTAESKAAIFRYVLGENGWAEPISWGELQLLLEEQP
jgi:nicotinamidase-related amidase